MSGSGAPPARLNIHATAIVYREHGFLIRGPSGSGKSALAITLIEQARGSGEFLRLVGDDRVLLCAVSGRLIARPHGAIEGLAEFRSLGIVPLLHEPACVIHGVIDIEPATERLPAPEARIIELLGIELYHLVIETGMSSPALLLHAMRQRVCAEQGLRRK